MDVDQITETFNLVMGQARLLRRFTILVVRRAGDLKDFLYLLGSTAPTVQNIKHGFKANAGDVVLLDGCEFLRVTHSGHHCFSGFHPLNTWYHCRLIATFCLYADFTNNSPSVLFSNIGQIFVLAVLLRDEGVRRINQDIVVAHKPSTQQRRIGKLPTVRE